MKAPSDSNTPGDKLSKLLVKDFGSVDAFKNQFADAAKNRFGSGWAWLVKANEGKLVVGSTPNQDNPLMNISDLKESLCLGWMFGNMLITLNIKTGGQIISVHGGKW